MPDALVLFTSIAVLLFVGFFCSWIGKKLRIPEALLLLIAGMMLSRLSFMQFPEGFLMAVSILALSVITFDSTAKWRDIDTLGWKAAKLSLVYILSILIVLSAAAYYLFNIPIWSSILLATLSIETFGTKGLLKLESIFNTIAAIILPFILVNISTTIEQIIPFLIALAVSIGTGIFIGIILFKLIQKTHENSPLAIILAALLSYGLAEYFKGIGVLAVASLGLLLAKIYAKEKITILNKDTLTKTFYITVFMLAGFVITMPLTTEFLVTSLLLFAVYLVVRFLAILTQFKANALYMTLNAPKDIATAAALLALSVFNIEGITAILGFAFAFLLYSITLSTIVSLYENRTH